MPLDHPYTDLTGGAWLRGNLHAHTTRSDGQHEPQALLDAYAQLGYGFMAISDHDLIASEADYKQWDARGMVLLPANEVTADGPHFLHIGGTKTIGADWRRQKSIDWALADAAYPSGGTGAAAGGASSSGPGSLVVINHPNWWQNFDHCPISLLLEWTGYHGIEIFNTGCNVVEGSAYALSKWDMVLSTTAGFFDGRPRRVWGFAHDDTHHPEDIGHGWLMAYVTDRSVRGVLDALKRGRFYCSTGVTIDRIAVNGMHVRIEAGNAHRIVARSQWGKRLAYSDGGTLEIDVPPHAGYARFECWGAGEQFAWTQPCFVVA